MARNENAYQADLIKEINRRLPGCLVLKNDANYLQGIPDLTVFYRSRWALLEVKRSADEAYQPNQEWYLEHMGKWSFTATIYPENEKEVLDDLQQALQSRRNSRVSIR